MTKFLKSFVCIVTSIVIFAFSVVPIQSSAAITAEKEMVLYANADEYCEYGIPYTPSYFQNLNGWTNCQEKWDEFVSSSCYDNRFYSTTVSDTSIKLKIVNYDVIVSTSQSSFKVSNCVYCTLTAIYSSSTNLWTVSIALSTSTNYVCYINRDYIAFSTLGESVLVNDGDVYYELFDENKDIGISDCIKKILSGQGVDILSPSLLDNCTLLGSLFNADLTASLSNSLGVGVEVGDDTYNEVINDLTNNTTTSNVWQQLDSSTSNNIKNSYSNFKQCLDNSLSVYNDDNSNYHYSTSNSTDNRNLSNYEGDTNTYYQTYIYNSDNNIGGSGSDSGNSGNSNNNSNGGAYAEANANAEGGNASIGDIIVNVPSGNGDSSSSDSEQDIDGIDISTFKSLLYSSQNFFDLLKNVFSIYPAVVWTCLASGITVVVICRLLGR